MSSARGNPGTAVLEPYKPWCNFCESNMSPMEEQPVLLTAASSHHHECFMSGCLLLVNVAFDTVGCTSSVWLFAPYISHANLRCMDCLFLSLHCCLLCLECFYYKIQVTFSFSLYIFSPYLNDYSGDYKTDPNFK